MAVTGMIMPLEIRSRAQYIFEHDWSFNKGYLPKIFDFKYFGDNVDYGVPVWDIGAGASMAFRKEIFQLAGDFDERLDVGASGCSGDSEMWYRVLAEGWNCYYNPRVLVYHQHRSKMTELKHQLFSYMRGHVSALLVQYEKYHHTGNLKRVRRSLPEWYFKRLKLFLKTFNIAHIRTIHKEIAGCISGWRFYNHNKPGVVPKLPEIANALHRPAVVNEDTLVSVIIPCYNYGEFLQQAIDSVWRQTHLYYQVIVVDDGSADDTYDICCKNNVVYVKTERVGVSAARNIGIAHSSGDYLVFLDADDILYPNALELNLFYFRQHPEIAMVSGAFDLIDADDTPLPNPVSPQQHAEDFYEALLLGNFIGMQSNAMYRRDLFFSFYFDPKVRVCEDYDLNLRISRHLPAYAHTEKIAAYRKHSRNTSVDSSLMKDTAIALLNKQKAYLNTPAEIKALENGKLNWYNHYA
jgi:GT2 family glycosyltransferase